MTACTTIMSIQECEFEIALSSFTNRNLMIGDPIEHMSVAAGNNFGALHMTCSQSNLKI